MLNNIPEFQILPHTDGLIGEKELALLPPDTVLVNVARGRIVQEDALYRALKARRLLAAGLDVWYRYPTEAERELGVATAGALATISSQALNPRRVSTPSPCLAAGPRS